MLLFRSLVFNVVLVISALITGTVVAVLGIAPYRFRHAFLMSWVDFILGALRLICGLGFEVRGKENVPDENMVAYIKHQSSWETIAQLKLFPKQSIVIKRSLLFIPAVGWGLFSIRSIAINRSKGHSAVAQVVSKGKKRLADGFWVMIFPEGTRMAPGKTRRYGISGALLAKEAGTLIVPVAHNAGDYWPRRGFTKKPGIIQVRIGPPISTADKNPREINDEAQTWIESQMREISVAYKLMTED